MNIQNIRKLKKQLKFFNNTKMNLFNKFNKKLKLNNK